MTNRPILALTIAALTAASSFAQDPEPAHFHHVRLNATNPAKTLDFYKRLFGAVEVNYRNEIPALFTERSFILINKVDEPPRSEPKTALSHVGWSAVTGQDEYDWLKTQDVEFQSDVSQLGDNYYQYLYGPDRELLELWTGGRNHRFDHVHLWATDVAASSEWMEKNLGLSPNVLPKPTIRERENISALWMSFVQCDNVGIIFFGRPDFDSFWFPGANYAKEEGPGDDFEPTKGSVMNHIAFSFTDIEAVYERMKANNADIQGPIGKDPTMGHKSFYVLAPDNLLVEIVQARPIPDSSWEEDE